jgi:acyl-CoA synthetase (AMP-forming)/AMP-acid ligase II
MLASTQFAHVGFMTKLPWYLRCGATMHVLDRWRAGDVLRTLTEHRIGTLGVVAPQLALMLRHPDLAELDVDCVQRIIAGGAASPPGLVAEARARFGAEYSIRYSSTESGGVGLGTDFGAPDHEALFTVGRPRPGVDVRIVSGGEDVADGETGELFLRTPAMFDGYWRDPEATATTLVDGWIRTGDLASRSPDGLVTLKGRTKEMYIRGGYNVAPAEVEAVLSEHPAIAAVAIVPRPDDVMGEIGVAVVVTRSSDVVPDLEDLRRFGGERLARWKLPEALVVVDELPLTVMQKLDRQALLVLVQATVQGLDRVDKVGSSTEGERSDRER